MEIGVTCVNPETTDFPSCAQKLTNGTWVCTWGLLSTHFVILLLLLLLLINRFFRMNHLIFNDLDLVRSRHFKRWTMHTRMLWWKFGCIE